ncbi:hypothetical protein AURDEDRAFT_185010 [Auricularia subglabra TFB-10046 SS5]|uniref:MYND-type domain-containing protein n=1 Tax=Auricularia subglabra (strain TFB-10046 / SS5) TaxID=717982 RepID=J0WZ50_AURST|nr:hypothetical protein AURDEDRAFT_185010 [Auricularia subglabra TFB-10046 SS5]
MAPVRDTELFLRLDQCLSRDNQLGSQFCTICLLAVPYALSGNSPDIPDLQTQYHDLWSSCMCWLAMPWRDDELSSLRRSLSHNIDNCGMRASHGAMLKDFGKAHVKDPFELFQILLCLCLQNCLYGIDSSTGHTLNVVARARNPRKRFCSKKGAWPTEIDQLFPYGERHTVRALAMASFWFADDSPLWVLNAILHLARPRLWSTFLDENNRVPIVWSVTSMILYGTGCVAGLRTLDQGVRRERTPPAIRDADWLRDGHGLHAASAFLRTILTGPYAQPDDILHFLLPHLATFRDIFRIAHWQAKSCRPVARREDWWQIALCVCPASAVAGESLQLVPDADVLRAVETDPRSEVILGIIRQALIAFPRQCAGPGCARTMLDDTMLPTCARCKIARYCIKNCQRADWTTENPIPHKRLCPVLSALRLVADPAMPQAAFAEAVRQSCLPDDYLILAGKWALSRGRYFMDILRVEIALPLLGNTEGQGAYRARLLRSLVER